MKNNDEIDEILVVDDTPANLKLLENLLRQAGYEVRAALDGELALRSIASKPPALILLDIKMPGMDGIEVCRRLKADTQTRDIPIIFISMLDDEQAKIRAFEAGGMDYINKPFSEAEVLARVNTHLRLRQAQKILERRYAELIEFEERLQTELEQRERAEANLQQSREHLEEVVAARTAQLEQEIAERIRTEQALRESEERLHAIFENVPIGMFQSTPEGQFVYVNPAIATMLGYASPEELMQTVKRTSIAEALYEDPARRPAFVQQVEHTQNNWKVFENRYRRKDGRIIDAILSFCERANSLTGQRFLYGFVQDITARKQTEAQINEQLEELQAWHTATMNRETRILELKQEINAILAQFGEPLRYRLSDSQASLPESDDSSFAPPLLIKDIRIPEEIMQKWQTIVDMISELLQTPATLIMKVEPPEIAVFVSSHSPQNPYHHSERVALNTGLYCETVMATRQKLLVPNALNDAQWDHNPDIPLGMISYLGFPITWPNGEMFGTICTLDAKEHAYSDIYQRLLLQFRDVIQTDLKHLLDFHRHLTEENEHHQRDALQSRRALLSMLEDAKRTETALQESESRYRQIVETSQEGVWLVDSEGKTLYVNQRMAEMLGYAIADVLERSIFQFLDPRHYQEAQAALRRRQKGASEIIELCFIRKDGSALWALNSASPIRDSQGKIIGSMGMLTDITDRKQAEHELQRLNAYNRSLIEASLDPLVTIGADGKIMDVNTATEVVTGYDRNVLIGTDFSDYFTEPERARAGYQKAFRDGLVRGYALELRHRDGHVTSVLYNAVVYRDETGEALGVFAAAHDITEQKQNDARVNSLLRLNQMVDASIAQIADFALDEGIFLTDSTMGFLIFLSDDENVGTIHAWSKNTMAECAIMDKPLQFVITETGLWGDVIRQRRPIILNDYAAPHPSKKGFPPGHVTITRYLSIPVFDAGRIVAVAAVANKHAAYTNRDARQLQLFMEGMWNIIRRKQAEEALRESEERFKIIATNTPDHILVQDNALRYIWVINPQLGLTVEDMIGHTDDELGSPAEAETLTKIKRGVLESGMPAHVNLPLKSRDGRLQYLDGTYIPKHDGRGNIDGLIGYFRNVTERVEAEEMLRQAKADLEAANTQLQELNASKDTFFSIIAHDLKNPMNSFLAFAEILEQLDEYELTERQKIINEFRISAEHLFTLLDNLLTWARSQQGRLPYSPQSLALDMMAVFAFDAVRPQADNKQIQLIMALPYRISVFADMDMLETIFRNLVTNAIKFTPKGGNVTISAQQTDDSVEIAVSDTGIGMTAETAAGLFQLGAKTRHLGTAGEKGTGLGLILCKEFVERHGGTIRCESTVGQGSVFRVTLPNPKAEVT